MGDKQSDSRVIVIKNCNQHMTQMMGGGGKEPTEGYCPELRKWIKVPRGLYGTIYEDCPLPRTAGAIKALEIIGEEVYVVHKNMVGGYTLFSSKVDDIQFKVGAVWFCKEQVFADKEKASRKCRELNAAIEKERGK